MRDQVGDDHVILGLSGGVDSSVAAALLHKAIGDQLTCVFVNNGLLRANEAETVQRVFGDNFHIKLKYVDASARFLKSSQRVTDPERKRKIIGNEFIRVFDDAVADLARKSRGTFAAWKARAYHENRCCTHGVGHPSGTMRLLAEFRWLAQGTLYPDVIESVAIGGNPAALIKSHHNVGGLPKKMKLKLVEPLRELFKDEVREVGAQLGSAEGNRPAPTLPRAGPRRAHSRRNHPRTPAHPARSRHDRGQRNEGERVVLQSLAKLRRAPAGAERRRDGRRAHLRKHHAPSASSKARTA